MTEETIDLFPIPVTKLNIGDGFSSETEALKKEEFFRDKNKNSHHFSSDNYVLNKQIYSNLKQFISEQISKFIFSKMNVDGEALITQSWVNWNHPKEFTHLHIHPNSIVSGVLYLEATENNNLISFQKPLVQNTKNYLEPKTFDTIPSEVERKYVDTTRRVFVKNGDLILFPSYLPHSVPTNNSNTIRISLAFNSISTKIGSRNKLTEIDFKILNENA